MRLSKVFYTNRFIKEWAAGTAVGPFIFIRSEYRGDAGLLAHELIHVEQFWRRPFTHGWKYQNDPAYRLACEVEAYRVQIKFGKLAVWQAAHFLVHWYDIPGLTIERATKLLL